MPKSHSSDFQEISVPFCRELAGVMRQTLDKLGKALNNPDFNYAFYSSPSRERGLEYFHWNIKIFPRLTSQAGFEVGSGIMINTVVPETAAKCLREA
jgi:UDPglucose--hexose-1-phosphate uridylyltransferase